MTDGTLTGDDYIASYDPDIHMVARLYHSRNTLRRVHNEADPEHPFRFHEWSSTAVGDPHALVEDRNGLVMLLSYDKVRFLPDER